MLWLNMHDKALNLLAEIMPQLLPVENCALKAEFFFIKGRALLSSALFKAPFGQPEARAELANRSYINFRVSLTGMARCVKGHF